MHKTQDLLEIFKLIEQTSKALSPRDSFVIEYQGGNLEFYHQYRIIGKENTYEIIHHIYEIVDTYEDFIKQIKTYLRGLT